MQSKILIIGSGNAALCAGIAALENGAEVLILEKASPTEAGGNSRYTAGAMRFVYDSKADLLPLLASPYDSKIANTEFGTYSKSQFQKDMQNFNGGLPLNLHQNILIDQSYATILWLANHGIKFEPIYSRQAFQRNGKYVFWGGLTLATPNEGVGLVEAELQTFLKLGGQIQYETEALKLIYQNNRIEGVEVKVGGKVKTLSAAGVILACGGFEANSDLRSKYMGTNWAKAKVRGTSHNTGRGIEMALEIGAKFYGLADGCHAVPMDANMPDYGNRDIPHIERKNYRKICYFLGVMLNAKGERFVDEGENFRNYTYAQFGRAILNQPHNLAWQIFDQKVEDLLYNEYRFWDAHYVEADSLEDLFSQLDGLDSVQALETLKTYNEAVDQKIPFNPTILDGKATRGLTLNKTNWANTIDTPPFKAYPVTCGITFTYAGLEVDHNAQVLDTQGAKIEGLFACGELIGGVFYEGYPGGSGLTSGAVFGKIAGQSLSQKLKELS